MPPQSRIAPQQSPFEQLITHVSAQFAARSCAATDTVVLGCSGGMDSMLLLEVLHSLHQKTVVVHVNYHLRGAASDADMQCVVEACERFDIPVEVFHAGEGYKGNLQEYAREFRYARFQEVAQEYKAQWILTAHHAQDQTETFFLHLFRGAGLNGLSGIPERQGKILRPLLPFTREFLYKAAQECKLHWREDESNAKTDYRRNQFRHEVLPELQKFEPEIVSKVAETCRRLKATGLVLEYLLKDFGEYPTMPEQGVFRISLDQIATAPEPATLLYLLVQRYGISAYQCAEACTNLTPGRAKHWIASEFILERRKQFFTIYKAFSPE